MDDMKDMQSTPEQVSLWKIVAATALCVVLLLVLVAAVIYGITGKLPYNLGAKKDPIASSTAAPTQTTAPPQTAQDLGLLEGIDSIAAYALPEGADSAALSQVVAKTGNRELTNAQLQVMFWNEFYRFVNSYDYSSLGLDPFSSMSEQYVSGTTVTWEQYFLHTALDLWHRYSSICIAAEAAGYELPTNIRQELDALPQSYAESAKEGGFADAAALLSAQMGPGVTMDDLVAVETLYALGDAYYQHLIESQNFTREEVEAYFDENAATFSSSYGITKDSGTLVDVRHVLIQPEGCTFDENGYVVATDDQWAACQAEAQKLLDGWAAAGATEDSFAELAKTHSKDGNASEGGLYQYIPTGYMVPSFNDWIFDTSRKYGDYGLVKTEFGYHLMFYVTNDQAWYIYAMYSDYSITSQKAAEALDAGLKANPMTVDFTKVAFGLADLSQDEEAE